MTLNEGQGHPNWYQNAELSGLIITPSLKEIGLQMSEHNPTLKFVCFFVCFFYYEIM